MAIITLTTDFGLKDSSLGAVKGAILSELDHVNIVDISHQVSPFHITEAAYIIKNSYKTFPKGSIHIIGVDSEITPENKHIALKLDDHYFICANNGIMSLIAAEINPEKIVEINIHDAIESNFPVLDVFVRVASHLARGGSLDVIGKPISEIKEIKQFLPFVRAEQTQLVGYVMYIDNYGNVVTNISRKTFEEVRKGRKFNLAARGISFNKIHNSYSEAINFETPKDNRVEEGKKLALFNASGYVELAIYKSNPNTVGSASTLFGLKLMDTINIKFE